MMNRTRLNFWLDAISLLILLAIFQTGFMMKYLLPPGTGHGSDGGPGLTILGWNRHGWGEFHWWLAVSLAGLMILHVALHWRWTVHTALGFFSRHKAQDEDHGHRRSIVPSGVAFLVLVLGVSGGSLLWAQRNIQGEYIPHHDHHHDDDHNDPHRDHRASVMPTERDVSPAFLPSDQRICGRLTLDEIAQNTGVSSTVIIKRLGLPDDVASNVPLSKLAEQYDFSIPQVRDIVNNITRR